MLASSALGTFLYGHLVKPPLHHIRIHVHTRATFSSVSDLGFCGYNVVELAVVIHTFVFMCIQTHIHSAHNTLRALPTIPHLCPLLTILRIPPTLPIHTTPLARHEDTLLL